MTASLFPTGPIGRSPSMLTASRERMGKSGQKVGRVSPSDDRTFAEHVSDYLRKKHPLKTAQGVASDTGIPATTIRKWLEQGCAPSGKHTAVLAGCYCDFLAAVFPGDKQAWFAEVARQVALEELEQRAASISQQLSDVLGGRL